MVNNESPREYFFGKVTFKIIPWCFFEGKGLGHKNITVPNPLRYGEILEAIISVAVADQGQTNQAQASHSSNARQTLLFLSLGLGPCKSLAKVQCSKNKSWR